MALFGRDKVVRAAEDFVDILKLVENVKSLQAGQKELADAIASLDERIRNIETDLRVARAEIRADALRETQNVVNAVQGGLNQRIQDLAVDLAILQHESERERLEGSPPRPKRLEPPAET